ncbi:MAG: hypothetical protein Q8Q62_11655, partial [Mesorhizobium sp.]|nr:hypothetical protein [Mesorhizobium sp.]
ATGVGILLVEQNARQSLKIARRGYLIENGHVTGEASAEALRNDPAVIAAYLGGAAGHVAGPTVHLPPSIRLPETLAAMGRMAGDLAGRAGSISQAFVRSVRSAVTPPSAFVGRYDPKAGGDPWAAVESGQAQAAQAGPARPPAIAEEARWLASSSANLALRASERLAQQIASARRGAPVPSAFQARSDNETAQPSPPPPAERRAEASRLNGSHGLIGHNSAAAGIDGNESSGSAGAAPAAPTGPLAIADLAERAAAIQKRHIEAQRRSAVGSPAASSFAAPAAERPASDMFVPGGTTPDRLSIADLAARADAVQKRHVSEGRKALTSFTVPASPSVQAHDAASQVERGKAGKKAKPDKKPARKGKSKKLKQDKETR